MRAITTLTDGSLLIVPEDADGLVLQNPDRIVNESDTAVSLSSEQPGPWPLSLDPEHVPQAGVAQQVVRRAMQCADSAHDFAVAEVKVFCPLHCAHVDCHFVLVGMKMVSSLRHFTGPLGIYID